MNQKFVLLMFTFIGSQIIASDTKGQPNSASKDSIALPSPRTNDKTFSVTLPSSPTIKTVLAYYKLFHEQPITRNTIAKELANKKLTPEQIANIMSDGLRPEAMDRLDRLAPEYEQAALQLIKDLQLKRQVVT